MTRRQAIEAAIAAWRDAERQLDANLGEREAVLREIAIHRTEFQRLCAQDIVVPMDTHATSHSLSMFERTGPGLVESGTR